MVKLNIPGTPQGKARPRFSRTGHAYTPDETRRYEARVAVLGKYAMCNRDIMRGAVKISILAAFLCLLRTRRNAAQHACRAANDLPRSRIWTTSSKSSAMDSTASRGRMTLKSLRSLLPKRTQSSHPSPSTSRSFHDRSDILQTLAKLESVHSSSQEIITFADSSGIKRTPPEVWPSSY